MKTVSTHKVRAILMLVMGGGLLALIYFVNPHLFSSPRAQAGLTQNVSGWTWGENIGWTSFNSLDCDSDKNGRVDAGMCGGDNTSMIARDYGVNVNTSTKATGGTGALSGTAWNEHVGWVSFDRTKTGNPPAAPLNGGSGPIAHVDWATGSTTGWMRAISACQNTLLDGSGNCTGSGAGNAAGGWDGWISLGGAGTGPVIVGYAVERTDYTVGDTPRGIAFDSVTNSMWVVNSYSGTVSKINVNTGARVNYSVSTFPTDIAFDPVTNSVWVTNSSGISNTVSKININTGAKVNYIVGRAPTKIAFDPVTNSVWVVSTDDDIVSKVNVNNGSRIDYPVQNGTAIAFDPITNSMWIGSGNTLVKINVNTGVKNNYVGGSTSSPYGMVFDPVTNSLRITNYSGLDIIKKVNIFNGSWSSLDWVNVGTNPWGIAFEPVTNSVWVANSNSNTVSKVDVNTHTRIDYPVGTTPNGVAFDPVTNSVWTTNYSSDSVSKLQLTPIYESLPYEVKIAADKFGGWVWGSGVTGWMDFSPKIGGISVGPVVGVPPCTISDVPEGSWGACQRIGSCPADVGSTMGIKVGVCATGATVTSACTLPALVCAGGPVGPVAIPGCNYHGACNTGETPITCPKDCKVRYLQF